MRTLHAALVCSAVLSLAACSAADKSTDAASEQELVCGDKVHMLTELEGTYDVGPTGSQLEPKGALKILGAKLVKDAKPNEYGYFDSKTLVHFSLRLAEPQGSGTGSARITEVDGVGELQPGGIEGEATEGVVSFVQRDPDFECENTFNAHVVVGKGIRQVDFETTCLGPLSDHHSFFRRPGTTSAHAGQYRGLALPGKEAIAKLALKVSAPSCGAAGERVVRVDLTQSGKSINAGTAIVSEDGTSATYLVRDQAQRIGCTLRLGFVADGIEVTDFPSGACDRYFDAPINQSVFLDAYRAPSRQ